VASLGVRRHAVLRPNSVGAKICICAIAPNIFLCLRRKITCFAALPLKATATPLHFIDQAPHSNELKYTMKFVLKLKVGKSWYTKGLVAQDILLAQYEAGEVLDELPGISRLEICDTQSRVYSVYRGSWDALNANYTSESKEQTGGRSSCNR
jgi:hypothetical protein